VILHSVWSSHVAVNLEESLELKAFLWTLGLVINEELRVLVCSSCKRAIGSGRTSIVSHLNKYHTKKGVTMHKLRPGLPEQLDRRLRGYRFANPDKVREQTPLRAYVPDIRVHKGFWCNHEGEHGRCHVTHRQLSSMKQHLKKHKSREVSAEPCDCQTLFVGSLIRFFPVSDYGFRGSTLAYKLLMQDQASKAKNPPKKPVEPFRDGELPSLVQQAQWHSWVSNFREDSADVVGLIEYPKSSQVGLDDTESLLRKLPRISDLWMDRCARFKLGASGSMLRYLKGVPL
jgi:hypothetical protein